jgi:hypothetical protein
MAKSKSIGSAICFAFLLLILVQDGYGQHGGSDSEKDVKVEAERKKTGTSRKGLRNDVGEL